MKDCKGAVTVFVTLLLIPAVLVSGTAVDLARIYTARSVVQNANQLAANSALAEYDALLQDLYGLFAISKSDPELTELVNRYVQFAIFTEDDEDKLRSNEMGTFQTFYGADAAVGAAYAGNRTLKNEQILRRQIEEYMKYRGPVIIVQQILSKIDKFKTVKKDAEVIEQKIELDESLNDLFNTYKDLKNKIDFVNSYSTAESAACTELTNAFAKVKSLLEQMMSVRSAFDPDASPENSNIQGQYDVLKMNLKALANGGTTYTWFDGWWNDEGVWEPGERIASGSYSTSPYSPDACISALASKHETILDGYLEALDDLVTACAGADTKKSKFKNDLEALKNNLDGTSDAMRKGMVGEDGNSGALNDDAYKVLEYETKPMAEAMRNRDRSIIADLLSKVSEAAYGIKLGPGRQISLAFLGSLSSNMDFDIDFLRINSTRVPPREDMLAYYAGLNVSDYRYDSIGDFEYFQSTEFDATKNREFYEALSELISEAENDSGRDSAESNLSEVLSNAKELFEDMQDGFSNNPDGALSYSNSEGLTALTGASGELESGFKASDMNNQDSVADATKSTLGGSIISGIGDIMGSFADKALLLTYDAGMFSCYTTEEKEKNITGTEMGVDVNYYFQSEQEYLFHGDIDDAKANLNSVTALLYVVRFVFNYVASFQITEINNYVNAARAVPYVGPLLAELLRVGFSLAETAIDVGILRAGRSVPIVKNDNTWRFSLGGLIRTFEDIVSEVGGEGELGDDGWMYYNDYLCIFLLFVNGDKLAARTSNLISLNLTNKKNNIGAEETREAREDKMSETELCKMEDYHTDITVTTTVKLRMIFLSMPFAQAGINGVVPKQTLDISVTDYRGY